MKRKKSYICPEADVEKKLLPSIITISGAGDGVILPDEEFPDDSVKAEQGGDATEIPEWYPGIY